MWHDAVRLLAEDPPSTSTPIGAIVALVGAAALLIGALTGLFATLRGRSNAQPAPAPSPLNSNNPDDEDDEEIKPLRARIRALETFLWRHRMNPNHIISGDEVMTDVEFQ